MSNSPSDKKEKKNISVSRAKKIMKCSGEVEFVSKDGAAVMAQAAEIFIESLAQQAIKNSVRPDKLHYNDVTGVIYNERKLAFLTEMVPKKITVKEYLQLMKEQDLDFADGTNETV